MTHLSPNEFRINPEAESDFRKVYEESDDDCEII